MEERALDDIRLLPRGDLEAFAIRAAFEIQQARSELEAGRVFLVALTGFLVGALVASAGFLLGFNLV